MDQQASPFHFGESIRKKMQERAIPQLSLILAVEKGAEPKIFLQKPSREICKEG